MPLLKPATNQTAFLKTGFLGFEGSGKTRTAVELAVGLTKLVGGKKIAFFDTEKGSDFHIERMKTEGLELFVVKSKSFKDLCDTIREAEREGYSYLIIDSITHVWRELVSSYLRTQTKRKNLVMRDWGILKEDWAQFTDLYVNSKLHISMLGRAGYEYDMDEDEDGKQEIRKSGTKMKVETETGYEPDLLIEMEKVRVSEVKRDKKAKGFVNRATILKDRTDTMNGKSFDFPKFETFAPVIKFLNLGGEHQGNNPERNSDDMFGRPDRSYSELQKRKGIAIERLQDTLVLAGLTGTAKETQMKRTQALVEFFGGAGQIHIENLTLEQIEEGTLKLKAKYMPKTEATENAASEPVALKGTA